MVLVDIIYSIISISLVMGQIASRAQKRDILILMSVFYSAFSSMIEKQATFKLFLLGSYCSKLKDPTAYLLTYCYLEPHSF